MKLRVNNPPPARYYVRVESSYSFYPDKSLSTRSRTRAMRTMRKRTREGFKPRLISR